MKKAIKTPSVTAAVVSSAILVLEDGVLGKKGLFLSQPSDTANGIFAGRL